MLCISCHCVRFHSQGFMCIFCPIENAKGCFPILTGCYYFVNYHGCPGNFPLSRDPTVECPLLGNGINSDCKCSMGYHSTITFLLCTCSQSKSPVSQSVHIDQSLLTTWLFKVYFFFFLLRHSVTGRTRHFTYTTRIIIAAPIAPNTFSRRESK